MHIVLIKNNFTTQIYVAKYKKAFIVAIKFLNLG